MGVRKVGRESGVGGAAEVDSGQYEGISSMTTSKDYSPFGRLLIFI